MISELVIVALAKYFKDAAADIKLKPGKHAVNETISLHLEGTVKKSKDGDYTPTVDIPLLATMALFLEKAGFMRETAKELLIDAMREALTMGDESSPVVTERVKDIEAAMAHVREITQALPKKTRNGATTVKVAVKV